MGGDSAACIGNSLTLYPQGKVTLKKDRCGAKWLFGSAGPGRLIQIIRYNLELPSSKVPTGNKIHGFLVTEFIPKLKEAFAGAGILQKKEGRDEFEGFILICLNGRIFKVCGDFLISEPSDPFFTLGSGGPEARGVLYFVHNHKIRLTPRKKLEAALKAAEASTSDVRRPFTYIHS